MYGLSIDGRAIVPIRAVSFASGGEVSPLTIALAVAERHRFIDERVFGTQLIGNWLGPDGTPRPMLAAEFAVTLGAVSALAAKGASVQEQIQALPSGVFIYRDELKALLIEINERRCASPPYGPGLAPIELSDWPRVSEGDESLILEGIEVHIARGVVALASDATFPSVSVRPVTPAALDSHGYDPEHQRRAIAIAADFRERKNRWPTKGEVAGVLAGETGKGAANMLRRIRKQWGIGRRLSQRPT